MEEWEEDGGRARKKSWSQGGQHRMETSWMERHAAEFPRPPKDTHSGGGRGSPAPQPCKPAGYMRRMPTKSSRRSVDNSDNLTPPWRAADTDTSSGLGIQSKKGKGPAWSGTKTAMRSSGSASQTATPLLYSFIDAEDADEEEFKDDDMEVEEEM